MATSGQQSAHLQHLTRLSCGGHFPPNSRHKPAPPQSPHEVVKKYLGGLFWREESNLRTALDGTCFQ